MKRFVNADVLRQHTNVVEVPYDDAEFHRADVDIGTSASEYLSLCQGEGDISTEETRNFYRFHIIYIIKRDSCELSLHALIIIVK